MARKVIQLLVELSLLVACGTNQQHAVAPATVIDSTGSSLAPLPSVQAAPVKAATTATPSPQLVRLVIFDEPI